MRSWFYLTKFRVTQHSSSLFDHVPHYACLAVFFVTILVISNLFCYRFKNWVLSQSKRCQIKSRPQSNSFYFIIRKSFLAPKNFPISRLHCKSKETKIFFLLKKKKKRKKDRSFLPVSGPSPGFKTENPSISGPSTGLKTELLD